MPDEFGALWQVACFLVTAGAVYGGIRSDLRAMHSKIEDNAKAIEKAHERLDDCMACTGRRRGDGR